jgi:hypothetical protein
MTLRDILKSDKSDDEKSVGWIHAAELPTDPDAYLSAVERASMSMTAQKTARWSNFSAGAKACVET